MQEKGLTSAEAERLLGEYGLNALPEKPPPSNISLIFNQLKSPLVYVLLVAAIITFFLHEYTDTLVIGIAVFINTVLGFFQEKKAGQALRALKELIHPEATVIRDGIARQVAVDQLVPGDLVVLNQGYKVPADGILVDANRLFVTESMLTGESVPVAKTEESPIYMGTVVTAGQAKFLVEQTGINTEIGKIAQSLDSLSEETPLKKQLVKFSKQLSILILILTALIFLVGFVLGNPLEELITTSVALAVSAIPEGLLVGLTVILAIGMQRILANKGLVRHLVSAETLGGVTTICVDKTGTLTQGQMRVVDVIGDEGALKFQTVVANDLDDPIVIAGYEWGSEDNDISADAYPRLDSLPFNSDNKYFASLNKVDEEDTTLFVNGAPEILLEKSTLDESEKHGIYDRINEFTGQGKRVLGFAKKSMPVDMEEIKGTEVIRNLEWVGLIAFSDPVREDVKDALEKTKKAGIRLVVITGDYAKTAVSVLNQIGIVPHDNDIILGSDLENMPDQELEDRLFSDREVKLFARTKPEQKMKIVQALKAKNEVVAMMGDGVNDAPAITASDIGIVVGDASDVAKESADLVLLDSSFKTIVLAIEEGRGIFDNLRKVILYLMCDAFVEIFLVFIALLLGFPLPITAAQILWVNLISDGFPSLALTIDPKEEDIMERAPRSQNEDLVSLWMKDLILIVSVSASVMAFILFLHAYKATGDIVFARSVAFAAVGVKSLVYVFSIKTLQEPFWKSNVLNNGWLIVAVAGGLLLQFTPFAIPALRNLFELVQIGNYWYGAFGAGALVFIVIELSKWILTPALATRKKAQV